MRSPYVSIWRDLSEYIMPFRGVFREQGSSQRTAPKGSKIISRVGTQAAKALAAFLMAGITSPARAWFRLSSGDIVLDDDPQVKLWLNEVERRIMKVMAESNFYNSMAAMYEEIATFGTAVMIIDQDYDDVIRCYTLTAGEYMLGMDDKLRVKTLYREITRTVEQLVRQFGYHNCSPLVQQSYRDGRLDREIDVPHPIHILRCRRIERCRSRWSPYH